jgi:hypothetical protein
MLSLAFLQHMTTQHKNKTNKIGFSPVFHALSCFPATQHKTAQAGRQAGMIGFITLQQSAPSQMTWTAQTQHKHSGFLTCISAFPLVHTVDYKFHLR